MKTCKTGCGKMKAGGSVKKMSKGGYAPAQKGGDNVKMGIYGMSNAGTTGPNRTAGYDYKKGGSIKKMKAGGGSDPCPKGYHLDENGICTANMFRTLGSKLGVGTVLAGAAGMGIKRIADKVKEKKAAKKAAEEQKKKTAETPKAKFGAAVGVKASCKNGMVRGADGKCVMERKIQKGGAIKKYQDGGPTIAESIKQDRREIMRTPSGKIGIIGSALGSAAIGAKMIADKIKSKKAEKKEIKKDVKNIMSTLNKAKTMKKGGSLKPVNKSANPGLAKLPTAVRNNMGYMKKGGVKKR